MEVSIPLDVAADLSLASPSLTFRATLHVTVLKSAPVAGTGILKTPRRVLFGLHSATMDAAAFRRWAMELAPTVRFEHTGPFGRRFSGPCRYRYGLHRHKTGTLVWAPGSE